MHVKKMAKLFVGLVLVVLLLVMCNGPKLAHAAAATPQFGSKCTGLGPNPTPLGAVPAPFLKVPFSESLSKNSLAVSNGWLTASDEIPVTRTLSHHAMDWEFENSPDHGYEYPVFSSTDGCAYASYQYISVYQNGPPDGKLHQYGLGAGLVIEVRAPNGFVIQYIHLSYYLPNIPFVGATAVPDPADPAHPDWSPSGLFQSADALFSEGVQVHAGQLLGFQGDTGIGLDWKDNYNDTTHIVLPRNRQLLPPWDPTQLHYQVYQGRDANFVKQNILDPFGLYAQITGPGSGNPYSPSPGHLTPGTPDLFLTDAQGNLEYAAP
ncbi:MAG TPA: hypothetical protein VNG90_02665 [Candidatus Acidoferrum sp.]|nr:hypothetical protein [Candidatus Acidoferrum sp.]